MKERIENSGEQQSGPLDLIQGISSMDLATGDSGKVYEIKDVCDAAISACGTREELEQVTQKALENIGADAWASKFKEEGQAVEAELEEQFNSANRRRNDLAGKSVDGGDAAEVADRLLVAKSILEARKTKIAQLES